MISVQEKYNHRLQKIFDLDVEKNLNLERINEILEDVSSFSDEIVVGWTSGIINNEKEVKKLFESREIEILTVNKAIEKISSIFKE